MATVTTIALMGSGHEPARSMTQELRTNGNRRHAKEGELLDPDELRRRLEAHLNEQRLQAERQRARAGVQKQSVYHHIPKVAAEDFARTATPEIMSQGDAGKRHVHRLGQVALKHHFDRVNIKAFIPGTNPLDLRYTLAVDQARMQRDLVGDRNQFQWTRNLEDAAEYDRERNLYQVPQRTFRSDHFHVARKGVRSRPLSTGDVIWEDGVSKQSTTIYPKTKPKIFPIHTANDRQDWAQRDEATIDMHRSVKQRVGPFLRRPDSMWMLQTKKEQNPLTSVTETDRIISEVDIKQKKGSFLRRFRRQHR